MEACNAMNTHDVSALLFDFDESSPQQLEAIRDIRFADAGIPLFVLLKRPSVERAVRAMLAGASDVFTPPFDFRSLREKIRDARRGKGVEQGPGCMHYSSLVHRDYMVFAGPVMKQIDFEITKLAQFDFDVLLTGETGVGKDMIAYELYARSKRRNRPFVAIPMRSLSESLIESELFGHEKGAFSGAFATRIGKLEAANGGTVYIPEISSLTENVQLKLLQFLQYKTISRVGQDARKAERQLDVRVILATNEPLEEHVEKGRMREDFYHRISGITVHIPPLRERPGEIRVLARHFLAKYSAGVNGNGRDFSNEVLEAMERYRWPGNVRELENAVKCALAHATSAYLTLADFPVLTEKHYARNGCASCMQRMEIDLHDFKSVERNFRRAYVQEVLRRCGNNVTAAAKFAGMTPQGFRKILRKFENEECNHVPEFPQ